MKDSQIPINKGKTRTLIKKVLEINELDKNNQLNLCLINNITYALHLIWFICKRIILKRLNYSIYNTI